METKQPHQPEKRTINSPYSKFISTYRQLLAADENYGTTLKNIQELLTFTEGILKSPAVAEVFFYFCVHGASTAWILQNELGIPEATAYRALKRLRTMKVVVPALKVTKSRDIRGGPRPTVWAFHEAEDTEIAATLRLHYNLLSPKYCVAERIAQTILEEYSEKQVKEIAYKEIIIKVKQMKIPFSTPDIAGLAADYLQERGIKVWR